MSETGDEWSNELMDEEDQLHEEMREEFRKRLQKRLQKRIETKEQGMPEVRDLKKKEGRAAADKYLWRRDAAHGQRILPGAKEVDYPHPGGLGTGKEPAPQSGSTAQALLYGGGDRLLRKSLVTCRRMGVQH